MVQDFCTRTIQKYNEMTNVAVSALQISVHLFQKNTQNNIKSVLNELIYMISSLVSVWSDAGERCSALTNLTGKVQVSRCETQSADVRSRFLPMKHRSRQSCRHDTHFFITATKKITYCCLLYLCPWEAVKGEQKGKVYRLNKHMLAHSSCCSPSGTRSAH